MTSKKRSQLSNLFEFCATIVGMTNADIAKFFSDIVSMLEIQGENRFRIRAYQQAAQMITGLPEELGDIYKRGGRDAVEDLPGIGPDLADKIEELVETGRLKFLSDLKKKVPAGLLGVMEVEGVGPKTAALVWKKFGVTTVAQLQKLALSGKLEKLPGFGYRKVQNIMSALQQRQKFGERQPIFMARPLAERIVDTLRTSGFVERVEIAGSIRRCKETIGDIDILATSKKPKQLMDVFVRLPQAKRVESHGLTRSTVELKNGMDCDLRVLAPDEFGAGLYYFTGSKEHNVAVRTIAVKRGLTISEYGVFKGTKERKGRRVAGRTEEEIFKALKLYYIPPEIRENAGEIEAAARGILPRLIERSDIKGNLHLHTTWSGDGSASPAEMLRAAHDNGFSYIAITDHASKMGMVKGIKPENIKQYIASIRSAEKSVGGVHALAGCEVDIERDGSLYLSDKELALLEWVVASIHSHFKQSKHEATKRLIHAIENPHVHCIGHPTTRVVGKRPPIEFDWAPIFVAAKKHGVVFEVNASHRMDLSDVLCRQAKAAGVKLCLDSDGHSVDEFNLDLGIGVARRGWLEKSDVVNTKTWSEFSKLL